MPQIIAQTGIPADVFYGYGNRTPMLPVPAAPAPAQVKPAAPAPVAPAAPAASQPNALQGNLNNFSDIQQLTEKINALLRDAQQQANAARIPNATALEQSSSANIGSALRGQLPDDVVYQLAQRAAERGASTGQPGGDQVNAAYLRALGLNSLNLQNTGQSWLSNAYARNPGAPLFDTSSLLITPYQQAQIDQRLREISQQQQRFDEQIRLQEAEINQRNNLAALQAFQNMVGRRTPTPTPTSYVPMSNAVGGAPTVDPRSLWPTYTPTYNDLLGSVPSGTVGYAAGSATPATSAPNTLGPTPGTPYGSEYNEDWMQEPPWLYGG